MPKQWVVCKKCLTYAQGEADGQYICDKCRGVSYADMPDKEHYAALPESVRWAAETLSTRTEPDPVDTLYEDEKEQQEYHEMRAEQDISFLKQSPEVVHVKPDRETMAMIKQCYPDYTGKKLILSTRLPSRFDSYWDGGSREYYCFYNLRTRKTMELPQNHPVFNPGMPRELKKLPEGVLIINRTIFQGKEAGITIFSNPENLIPLLPPSEDLTHDEYIVVMLAGGLKSSYAGISDYRRHEAIRKYGMSGDVYDATKRRMIERGMLNKRGAITTNGKNAVGAYKRA